MVTSKQSSLGTFRRKTMIEKANVIALVNDQKPPDFKKILPSLHSYVVINDAADVNATITSITFDNEKASAREPDEKIGDTSMTNKLDVANINSTTTSLIRCTAS